MKKLARMLAVSALIGTSSQVPAETYLNIEFTDESGQAVVPSSAELLLVAWGETQRLTFPLESGSNRLRMSLDEAWLRSHWPERSADLEKAYLYFTAEGLVPVRSEPFLWIGSDGPPQGFPVTSSRIALPSGESLQIQRDESRELRVVFRQPADRALIIRDTTDAPIEGVSVRLGMFWAASNHCGLLTGNDPLAAVVSDAEGRAAVPDGDFEYAIELDKQNYVLAEGGDNSFSPPRLITYLESAETVIRMRELERKPLSLLATEAGMPVGGLVLMGALASCGCGACDGPLGTTDARGEMRIPDFYPERYSRIYFLGSDGQVIWQADPGSLDVDGPFHVVLGQ